MWWSARDAAALLRTGDGAGPAPWVPSTWDVAASHRLLHGGTSSDPAVVWAVARGLDPDDRPRTGQLDLLSAGPDADDPVDPDEPVRSDGHLRPGWAADGPPTPAAAARWAAAALEVQAVHEQQLAALPDGRPDPGTPGLAVLTAWSESAAELLCVELGRARPAGRPRGGRGSWSASGSADARPTLPTPRRGRARRDDAVRGLVTGAGGVDLRNPAQVRELLGRVGIDVPDTRAWRLEPFRGTASRWSPPCWTGARPSGSPRRTATAGWTATSAPDGRLRGVWTGCDGAAGRMTASAGLHNMPAELRPAVAAEPGHVLVRADLGQIEPRVLAAVSGDAALARATADDDLYAPVARRLASTGRPPRSPCSRAMYGQTTGAAGEALRGLERPTRWRWATCDAAHESGAAGRTCGRTAGAWSGCGRAAASRSTRGAAPRPRGRFAPQRGGAGRRRRAVQDVGGLGARRRCRPAHEIVLCLHDELLVHVPEADAADVVDAAARRARRRRRRAGRPAAACGSSPTSPWSARWSEAKD